MNPRCAVTILLACFAPFLVPPARAGTKLLRFPDIHGDRVAFAYAGDLWTVSVQGGTAVRLTAHPGLEIFPKFSPDGRWIAFTGQYDGDEQVYVIPSGGGIPRQLTYYPAKGPMAPRWGWDNQVYGWTPDGRSVLFRSLRDGWDPGDSRLWTVSLEGGLPEPLPMPRSGAGDFSPDGRLVVYSPLFRDFRTWKRYEGGWAQDLYIFDPATGEARVIASSPRTERDPMWIGGRIYFASDRTGTLNLYAFDTATGTVEPLTRSTTWDVRWPSADERGRIVYESNGELRVLDTRSGEDRPVPVTVPDDGVAMRPRRIRVDDFIEDFSLSPKGERALFVARGEVFSAPIEKGPTRNLTRTPGAHDKWARWSPDGSRIAFVSDRSGEDEIWVVSQDGSTDPERLTTGGNAMRYAPAWSPDGKRMAFSDKDGKVLVLETESGRVTEVADEARGQVRDYAWAPGGGHLAFSLSDPSGFRSLYVWSAGDGIARRITGPMFQEYGPAWDPAGEYLYFLSDREFAPQISGIEWNYATNRQTGIFALSLRRDVPDPFPPESDEVTIGDEGRAGEDKKGDSPERKRVLEPIRIDFDGLADRVVRVPVEADNLSGLAATGEHLVYLVRGARFYGRESYPKPSLRIFSLKDRKESVVAEDVAGFAIAASGEKVLVRQKDVYRLFPLVPDPKDPKTVSTADLSADVVPAEEWRQIFEEVWRRFRDFFYVRNMHGYDWAGLRDRYRPWLEHVAHRSDLNYLLGEMVAELNVGHAYIQGGDFEIPERAPVALPGARFELDRSSGRYRIARILRGQNEEERYRSPLTAVGIDVHEGDYVLEVDGEELRGDDNPYRLLRHKTDPVTLTVHDRATLAGARKVTYVPIRTEEPLLYLDWVEGNRRKVEEATEGRAGYLHIPDMGAQGIREFIKWFYPQIRREGMVIDVRGNGGGNVSQWILERLDTKLLGTRFGSTFEGSFPYPGTTFYGHLVCLLNETSASDGDIFPYMFRQAGLGPLIGKRSWGGTVGISDRGPLIDGGQVFVPQGGIGSVDGTWVIEGHGVDPDIVVDNDVRSVLAGRDPQLERGIQELMRRMREEPLRLPDRPPDPVKTP